MNFAGAGFDLAAHTERVQGWRPAAYPDIDIYLPICGEPIELLRNTWTAVAALIEAYPGQAQAHVLDDGPDRGRPGDGGRVRLPVPAPAGLARGQEGRQPALRLRQTTAELFVIFDADFAPRPDFLAETLPYLDDPQIAIVQTPQYFRSHAGQTWIERAAGPIQEVFYRTVQVARNRLDAAVCCGTSAVYRRRALEPFGGPTLIPYAEDVHTGLDVRSDGWSVVYLPILLSTGICPDNLDSLRAAAVPVVLGQRRHRVLLAAVVDPMSIPARLTYISGFCYYAYTALLVFFGPLIPIVMLAFLPGQIRAAQLRHPAPGHVHRVRAVPAVAPRPVRAGHLAAGHRPGLGARVRHLGRCVGQDHELASDPDPGQLAAAVPDRRDLVERRRGRGLWLALAIWRTVAARLRGGSPCCCSSA